MNSVTTGGAETIASRSARSEVLVILAGRNERRHVAPLFDFYLSQGVDLAYLDDGSADGTLDQVLDRIGSPVVWAGARRYPGQFDLAGLIQIKEELIRQAPHRWVIHADMDEYRRAPDSTPLPVALDEAARAGANAVNFQEFTFLPVLESPDHDHPRYRETLRWYYPFLPRPQHRLNAFMPSRLSRFDLVSGAGHRVRAAGLRVFESDFVMEHYPFLSIPHFLEQYPGRRFSSAALERGWHGNRTELVAPALCPGSELYDRSAVGLVVERPRTVHSWTVRRRGSN